MRLSDSTISLLNLSADIHYRIISLCVSERDEVQSNFESEGGSYEETADMSDGEDDFFSEKMKIGKKRKETSALGSTNPRKKRRTGISQYDDVSIWHEYINMFPQLPRGAVGDIAVEGIALSEGNAERLVRMLHVLSIILRKYPSIMPPVIHSRFVEALDELLHTAQQHSELQIWALYTLIQLAECTAYLTRSSNSRHVKIDNMDADGEMIRENLSKERRSIGKEFIENDRGIDNSNWKRIWTFVVRRVITKNNFSRESLRLMASILKNNLLIDTQDILGKDFWKLSIFDPPIRSTDCVDRYYFFSTLAFLKTFLSKCELIDFDHISTDTVRDGHATDSLGSLGNSDSSRLSLNVGRSVSTSVRERLMNWLLFSFENLISGNRVKISTLEEEVDTCEMVSIEPELSRLQEAEVISSVLFTLIVPGQSRGNFLTFQRRDDKICESFKMIPPDTGGTIAAELYFHESFDFYPANDNYTRAHWNKLEGHLESISRTRSIASMKQKWQGADIIHTIQQSVHSANHFPVSLSISLQGKTEIILKQMVSTVYVGEFALQISLFRH